MFYESPKLRLWSVLVFSASLALTVLLFTSHPARAVSSQETPLAIVSSLPKSSTAFSSSVVYLPSLSNGSTQQTPNVDELSAEARFNSLQEVETKIDEVLPATGTPVEDRNLLAELEQLSTAMLDAPNVAATYLMTDTLTLQVVLNDGLSFLIVNNRPPESTLSDGAASAVQNSQVGQLTPAQDTVPGSPNAVVANFDGGASVAGEVRSMLQNKGYQMSSTGAGIGTMRSHYKDLGALYLDTHGASFLQINDIKENNDGSKSPVTGDMVYALQTSTEMLAVSLFENYLEELRNGDVVVSFSEWENGWRAELAITEKFIAKHWTFDNGIVMIHSCFGGSGPFGPGASCQGNCSSSNSQAVYDPTPLRQAMLNNGADVVVSFDDYTNAGRARPSILYFFDRMLGADTFRPESPPLRPFAAGEVQAAMAEEGLLNFYRPAFLFAGAEFGGNNVGVTFDTSGTPGALAPSVQFVDVVDDAAKSQGELTLTGSFGDDQGSVKLGGVSAGIQSWSRTEIVAETPFDGAGASGDLVVEAPDSVAGNEVPITLWDGEMNVVYEAQGNLQAGANMDVKFRAELHQYRTALDGSPQERTVESYFSGASSGSVTAQGTAQMDGGTVTWSGGGSLDLNGKQAVDTLAQGGTQSANTPSPESAASVGQFGGLVTLDPANNQATLCVFMEGTYDITIVADGQSNTYPGVVTSFVSDGLVDSMRGLLSCFNTTLQDNYVIAAGSRSVTIEDATFEVEWTQMTPTAAPTDDTPG